MSPTADRFREDYDPEPDYDRPTRAEAEADERGAQPYRAPAVKPPPVAPKDCTNTQLADRLRRAADRVAGSRPDLAILLEEAAERLDGGPF